MEGSIDLIQIIQAKNAMRMNCLRITQCCFYDCIHMYEYMGGTCGVVLFTRIRTEYRFAMCKQIEKHIGNY